LKQQKALKNSIMQMHNCFCHMQYNAKSNSTKCFQIFGFMQTCYIAGKFKE